MSRQHLYSVDGFAARFSATQTRFFGRLIFGALYIAFTVAWVAIAPRIGLDNAGLTIYTFLVSVLAIYMSNVITNTLNRQAERDKRRDDHEAEEVSALLKLQYEQLHMLDQHREQLQYLEEIHAILSEKP